MPRFDCEEEGTLEELHWDDKAHELAEERMAEDPNLDEDEALALVADDIDYLRYGPEIYYGVSRGD